MSARVGILTEAKSIVENSSRSDRQLLFASGVLALNIMRENVVIMWTGWGVMKD